MNTKIKKWIDSKNINLLNKNVFITGANSGIGFELSKKMAYLNANIFMLIRNIDKGIKAKEEILKEYKDAKITLIEFDLASFKSIDNAIKEITKYDVDVFINNAGIFRIKDGYTKDNIEITMGTNFIGVKYLNDQLNKYFISLKHKVYNIFTTSVTSYLYKIDYDDFYSVKSKSLIKKYARTKACINDMYFSYLDEYKSSNIIFSIVHPGGTYTPLISKGYKNKLFNALAKGFMNIFFHSPEKASLVDIYALLFDYSVCVCPRGLFELSGYPKLRTLKRNKDYLKTIDYSRIIISEVNSK